MSLVPAIDLVRLADEHNTAVMCFNTIDYNMVKAVINAAEKRKVPALVQLLPEHSFVNKVTKLFISVKTSISGFHLILVPVSLPEYSSFLSPPILKPFSKFVPFLKLLSSLFLLLELLIGRFQPIFYILFPFSSKTEI